MTIQKIRHKELNETFFKTVFYDDDAQNSGQARGKSLTKSKTESLKQNALSSNSGLHSRPAFSSFLKKVMTS